MLKRRYRKSDGEVFRNPLTLNNGAKVYNPAPELLAEYGYFPVVGTPVSGGEVSQRVYKFDRYLVITTLGDKWPEKRTELEAAGLLDLFMAAPYLSTADAFFAPVYKKLSQDEKRLLHKNCRLGG